MDELPVFERFKEIMETIEYCLNTRRILPALILIYTFIDSISWLASDKRNESVKKRFTKWVDNWMLKKSPLPCSSLELYAARCGILHSLISDSDLSTFRKVKRITYSFGDKSPFPLQQVSDHIHPNEFVVVKVEDLYENLKVGLITFLENTIASPDKKSAFEQKATRHFTHLNPSTIDAIISKMDKQ